MEIELYKSECEEKMEEFIKEYNNNISKISIGRANPEILKTIKILYYETLTPINELSSIFVPEANQLLIQPFDRSTTKDITKSINDSSIKINAVDEGDKIRMLFPALTTESRKELVKSLSSFTEQAKIGIRLNRKNANKLIKKDDELSEDQEREYLDEIQTLTNFYISKIEKITNEKEKDLMTI